MYYEKWSYKLKDKLTDWFEFDIGSFSMSSSKMAIELSVFKEQARLVSVPGSALVTVVATEQCKVEFSTTIKDKYNQY